MPAASRPRRHVLATFGALTLVGTALPLTAGASWAAATASTAPKPVTASCSETSLQKAIKAGGDLVFKSNCTLTLTSTLVFSGSHAVTLDGNGHKVVLNAGGNFRAVSITGGTVTLAHLTIENGNLTGANGAAGGNGGDGSDGGTGGTPTPVAPGNGTAGGAGHDAQGGGLNISGGTVVLNRVSFTGNKAVGGDGGSGGNGGQAGNGGNSDPTGAGATSGTVGGNGAKGGNGGTAEGGAIANAGHLIVIGGTFAHNTAQGGNGGNGGAGANGGNGGDDENCTSCSSPPGSGGDAGSGAKSGDGGDSYGGAIYSTGYLLVDGSSFSDSAAIGGTPGISANGGNGGTPGCVVMTADCSAGTTGNGGDGGIGGNAGGAIGGAISLSYNGHGKSFVTSPSFSGDSITGGTLPSNSDCPPIVAGCPGLGGTGATPGDDGYSIGTTDRVKSPDSSTATTTLASVALTTKSLAKGKVGAKYHVVLKATGGIKPYTYKAKSLPKGLACSTTGVISGRPTKAGTKKVSITVTDAQAIPPTSAKVALKLVVK